MSLTPLQQRVAREIVAYARRENLPAGHHLTRLALAREIGERVDLRFGIDRHHHGGCGARIARARCG